MKEVLVLKDLEQIKAVSQQYRLEILEAFDSSAKTAKQIAEAMHEPHGRVNYHIKMLEKVGIIEFVEEVIKFGVVEKYYAPVAYKLIIDSSAVTLDDEMNDSISKASLAFFETISREFYDSIEHFSSGPSRKISYSTDYYLTEEEAKELYDQLNQVADSYLKGKEQPREGTHRHFAAHMVVPLPPKES
ncbi:ArsR/SmtB family transcription factor [Fusibacter ferrireducens]|uniref:Helix-turn-helix transcriptional regulator n=1 Tax=Fusibacter ferrireducens TaxID=2785058 RepID=A0ABR9ZYZ4_9FIRM|nr:helix-turn-helix domain-containing protein [Fusibacter ferrireducens]MBF4695678.1 helix-turn-helix transcriptional regulator [Fusibacter ferrireducens]